ncbi:type 1 glutamine amidotransferase domain-containing protein [Rummeliibacillus stabekisii]|uniref:type 1 glutamine amidotransferase domain-containing protein n=1 Tax=Rummeliibacillus stabekisii TaxID=241244 RepID=UPI00203B1952|nr:type 1 glutamine amidotransferase domain-containing protein [Rummeliibacillus stabekisii]MCM3317499.1 type 1 glutamine amidotransferase domain-containing protein [Rummeliibacillus stabekisii]
MKKILLVVTNISKYPNLERATGLWLGEAVHFADEIEKEGYQIDYVSPKGGYTPLDPHSLQADQMTELDWKYYANPDFLNKLSTTLSADSINPNDYDAIYYAGGHGVMWDFAEDESLQNIASTIYANGGVVSAVCHGVVGLLNIKNGDGEYLIKNTKVTGFTNTEEIAVGLDKAVPFLTEDELIRKGANYVKGADWSVFTVTDNRIVTGQNPASGGAVAKEVIKVLKSLESSPM